MVWEAEGKRGEARQSVGKIAKLFIKCYLEIMYEEGVELGLHT